MSFLALTPSGRKLSGLWSELARGDGGEQFDPAAVNGLPAPARRFLLRSIAPGTPLARSVELEMHGTLLLSPDRPPLPMRAHQILAPPDGFIWRARATRGLAQIRGFDRFGHGEGEMRWKLWGLIPVMRSSGDDVTRSAAGRLALEAVVLPSALVPGRGAEWEGVDDERVRFRMKVGEERVVATLEVDPEGRPTRVSGMRWSDQAGPGYDLFVAEFSGEIAVDGYTIPSRLEAGWRLGQPDEFRFFEATLDRATFR